jgi:endonuclease/exonuclease/phosphatase family metal-dependent hydrolase
LLPDEKAEVFGLDHPFLDEIARDVVDVCLHPNAGDFVICGWHRGAPYYTFPIENGSHAGPGPEETRAFAVLPEDTVLPVQDRDYLRPYDLRRAAQHHLGYAEIESPSHDIRAVVRAKSVRIMTYNVHSCVGMDGKAAPERIARVIARYKPDIVALQELDVERQRTGGIDQAQRIARLLQMKFHFHPAIHLEEERYGDAILTHLPMRLVRAGALPGLRKMPSLEPRGALWASIEVDGTEIQVLNTHLGLMARERRAQMDELLGNSWLGHPDCHGAVVFCGDLNALPSSAVCRRLGRLLTDVQVEVNAHRPKATFFTRFPSLRIDHIYVDRETEVLHVEVPNSALTRLASDHLPLIANICIAS